VRRARGWGHNLAGVALDDANVVWAFRALQHQLLLVCADLLELLDLEVRVDVVEVVDHFSQQLGTDPFTPASHKVSLS